jgi:thiaminase
MATCDNIETTLPTTQYPDLYGFSEMAMHDLINACMCVEQQKLKKTKKKKKLKNTTSFIYGTCNTDTTLMFFFALTGILFPSPIMAISLKFLC